MASVEIVRPPVEAVVLSLSEDEAVAVATAVGYATAGSVHSRVYRALASSGLAFGHPRYEALRKDGGFR